MPVILNLRTSPRKRVAVSLKLLLPALFGSLFNSPMSAQEAGFVEEITRLAESEIVAEALEAVIELDDWSMDQLVALTEIPAPPFGEGPRAEAYAKLLESAGADSVRMDSVGNVIAFRGGTSGRRTVVLGAHLDTVFPEGTDVTVRMRGDTLFAPGVGDDSRGLVVVLAVLRVLADVGIETDADLIFLGSVGEEGLGDLRGVKHFFAGAGSDVDAVIEVDGGGIGSIVSMGLGSTRYRVTFTGPGGHSWGAFGMVNPAHALGRAIAHFSNAADSLTRSGPRTSFNVGRIGGGTSINSIPFESWMEVDMRSESPEKLEEISAALLDAVERATDEENRFRREGPEVIGTADLIGSRPSGETDPSAPLVQRAMAAARFFGEVPSLSRSSTNSNIPISLGIPAVTIGRGGEGGGNHSPQEWWLNRDGYKAIQQALLILVAEAGLSSAGD